MDIVNLRLMSHPINWLFVWVTLALFSIAFTAVHERLQSTKGS